MDRFTELRTIAAALEGKEVEGVDGVAAAALDELLSADGDGSIARRHRAGPSLALLARRRGSEGREMDGPALPLWRRQLMEVAAHHMVLAEALERTARVLHAVDVPWVPLKGLDLATRVYDEREERPTSDLDLLIAPEHLDRARQALVESGVVPLADDPRCERYLLEEGYAWQASDPRGGLIELHFRLWGSAPDSLARLCLDAALRASSAQDPDLPAGGHRLPLEHAFVVGAVHAWLDAPPRGLHPWRDLLRIGRAGASELAERGELAERIVALATETGLELPLALAAEVTTDLFPAETPGASTCRRVARTLDARLHRTERRFVRRWRGENLADAPLAPQVVARALARRPLRHGLVRLAWRRLWPHAGVVAGSTDGTWPWPLRRAWYQCRVVLGAEGLSDRLAALAGRRAGGRISPVEDRS